MYTYSLTTWIILFFIYCFIGWIWESGYASIRGKKFVNRGFLHGPVIPIYGFGAILVLHLIIPVRNNLVLVFLIGMIGATALEYATGYVMEKIFQVKYWDYSNMPFSLNGYICLPASLAWGVFSILLIHVIHEPIEYNVFRIPQLALLIIDIILSIAFITDLVFAVKEAFDLKKIIQEQILQNEQVERMQKRMDVLLAFAEDDAQKQFDKMIASKEDAEKEIARLRSELANRTQAFQDEFSRRQRSAMRILRRNPKSSSTKHKIGVGELRKMIGNFNPLSKK